MDAQTRRELLAKIANEQLGESVITPEIVRALENAQFALRFQLFDPGFAVRETNACLELIGQRAVLNLQYGYERM